MLLFPKRPPAIEGFLWEDIPTWCKVKLNENEWPKQLKYDPKILDLPEHISKESYFDKIFQLEILTAKDFVLIPHKDSTRVWDIRDILRKGHSNRLNTYKPNACVTVGGDMIWKSIKTGEWELAFGLSDNIEEFNSDEKVDSPRIEHVTKELNNSIFDEALLTLSGLSVEEDSATTAILNTLNAKIEKRDANGGEISQSKFALISTRSVSAPDFFKEMPVSVIDVIVYRPGTNHGKMIETLYDTKNKRILVATVVGMVEKDVIDKLLANNQIDSISPAEPNTNAEIILKEGVMKKNDYVDNSLLENEAVIGDLLCNRMKNLVEERGFFYLSDKTCE